MMRLSTLSRGAISSQMKSTSSSAVSIPNVVPSLSLYDSEPSSAVVSVKLASRTAVHVVASPISEPNAPLPAHASAWRLRVRALPLILMRSLIIGRNSSIVSIVDFSAPSALVSRPASMGTRSSTSITARSSV